MSDRTLRTVVTGLTGLLVLVIAVTLLIMVGRSGQGTASPSAAPVAIASPTVTPPESAPPAPSASAEANPTTAEPTPSDAVPGSPRATGPATLTFVALKLDSTDDLTGQDRIVTFRTDGPGNVTAKLATKPGQGKTHMCMRVGNQGIGCEVWSSGTFAGRTAQLHADWTVTLRGSGADSPTIDLTVTFISVAPSVTIEHARFDGTAAPDMNGINARFGAQEDGEVRLVAEWGGHPLLYKIDLFDENEGQVSTDLGAESLEPSTNVDDAMPVTAGNWRLLLRNAEDGFGTTDLTATISWP